MTDALPTTVSEAEDLLSRGHYVAGRDLATVVFLALKMGRPLLLEGEAGVGKTEIAKVLAAGLDRELIRLQCEIARSEEVSMELWRRERELIAEFGESWVAPLTGMKQPPKIEFERGFVKKWSSTPTEFAAKKNAKCLREFFSGFGLESLLLRNSTKRIASIAECPLLD